MLLTMFRLLYFECFQISQVFIVLLEGRRSSNHSTERYLVATLQAKRHESVNLLQTERVCRKIIALTFASQQRHVLYI